MTSISRAHSIIGFNPDGRPVGDFYPTPPSATIALLENATILSGVIWEPACGDGAISRVIESAGRKVVSADLYDHGYGTSGIDFLKTEHRAGEIIITNPPFNLAEKFLEHALAIGIKQIYFLLKLAFLEGARRSVLLESTPLTRVMVFRKRLNMTRNGEKQTGSGMIAFAWYEWRVGYVGRPEVSWI